ncbi:MAG: hypothetical protein COS88_01325 [Chloroflexi bacterium CG07_land_8_20_14_0_80_51_10]|nr:MAG: hypothetical protein COS88_01325 [Chloroflexi bacterium CG07_land_8_20_14_0_80_51_10]
MHRKLTTRAYRIQREIESGKRVIVGVNKYQTEEEREMSFHRANPEAVRIQIERLKRVKSERNTALVEETLRQVHEAAEGQENLIPPLIEAVKAYATVGEITATLKDVFGVFQEPVNI